MIFKLATKSDFETFVMERSPHAKSVEVLEEDDKITLQIKLSFWYRFWFERSYYAFIDALINEHIIFGLEYDIELMS